MHTFTLPSATEIDLVEMTGVEEDLLTNQRLIKTGEAINQVLANCIKRIGENDSPGMKDILDMLSGDRLFALERLAGHEGHPRHAVRRPALCSGATAAGVAWRRGRLGTRLPQHRLRRVQLPLLCQLLK